MYAHATGLALLVLGGKRDENALRASLLSTGLDGALTPLCVAYLKGAIGQGPVVTMVDFVGDAAKIIAAQPHLGPRIEACLRPHNLTVAQIEADMRKLAKSEAGAFASAMGAAKTA